MKKQEARRPGSLVLFPPGKHKYIHFTYLPRCYHCGVPYAVRFLSCSFLFLPNIAHSSWLANCWLIVGSSEKVDNLWSNPEYEDTSRMLTSPPFSLCLWVVCSFLQSDHLRSIYWAWGTMFLIGDPLLKGTWSPEVAQSLWGIGWPMLVRAVLETCAEDSRNAVEAPLIPAAGRGFVVWML